MAGRLHAASSGVAHHLPHRTRLRVPKQHRTKNTLTRMSSELMKTPWVRSVDVNHRTGSVILYHDEHPQILAAVEKTIGEVSAELLESLIEGGSPELTGLSIIGHLVQNLFSSLDDQLSGATMNVLDLRSILPLVFLGAGVLRLRKGRGEDILMTVSPIVFFYYAFDMYWRLHIAYPPNVETISDGRRLSKRADRTS